MKNKIRVALSFQHPFLSFQLVWNHSFRKDAGQASMTEVGLGEAS